MQSVEMEATLRQRPPRARRLLMGLLVGAVVALTVGGLILAHSPGLPASLGALIHGTPTPTPAIASGGDTVFYEHGAPWGRLTLDGRDLPLTAGPSQGYLPRGRHTVAYQAAPFPSLRCTISTPAAASDTCPLDPTFTDDGGRALGARRALNLGSTLDRLPADQRASLLATVKRLVEYTSAAATVPPGDHYAGVNNGAITVETAAEPLTASIQVRLQSEASPDSPAPDCATICLPPSQPIATSSNPQPNPTLDLWAHVKTGYHYTTASGAVALDYGPQTQITQASSWTADGLVDLQLGWNGTWQVAPMGPDNRISPCSAGDGDFYGGGSSAMLQYTVTGTRPATNPTDGCLVVVRETDQAVPGPPILFLEHFGVLLAVNGDAAQLRPWFPLANAGEASLAYAIAAQAPLP